MTDECHMIGQQISDHVAGLRVIAALLLETGSLEEFYHRPEGTAS
jgi:hypothetical protein